MKNSAKKILAFLLCFEMILSLACNSIPVVHAMETDGAATEQQEEVSLVGRLVKFTVSFPYLWDKPDGTQVWANASLMPSVLRIVEVCEDSSGKTLYLLEGVEGEWDAIYDGCRYGESSQMALIEEEPEDTCDICGKENCTTEHVWCDICEDYDCGKTHTVCNICGKPDCTDNHVYCNKCGEYDCGKIHSTCGICGKTDCTDEHVWCETCGDYDCGIDHDKPYEGYIPPTEPVIPENPSLPADYDVAVVDANGKTIDTKNGISLLRGGKTSISAWSELGENVNYQWQVCYNNANQLWMDIYGATEKGLLISPAMFRNIVDYYGKTYVRCVTTGGGQTSVSDPIPVVIAGESQREVMLMSASLLAYDSEPAAQADTGTKHTITVVWDTPGQQRSWVAYIAHGADYDLDVECPDIPGYVPANGLTRVQQSFFNITENITIVVEYEADYMDFVVEHYWQHVADDGYDLHETVTVSGLKTGESVGTNLKKTYTGFDKDPFYDPTITVAADGSTVVKIFYDREYYMVYLDLNGGYGAEPMFARYETPITIPDPQRTGYTFDGWKSDQTGEKGLAATVPNAHTGYTAQWTPSTAKYTVAFYHENANDNGYTFVGSIQKESTTGASVTATYADYQNSSITGKDTKNFPSVNSAETATVNADGTTVVRLYLKRQTYTLTYWAPICSHINNNHDNWSCCSKTPHSAHVFACVSEDNGGNVSSSTAASLYANWLNKNGTKVNFQATECALLLGNYYIYYNGNWYRIKNYGKSASYVCSGIHTHGDGNCSACPHQAQINADNPGNCGCHDKYDTASEWTIANNGTAQWQVKYGARVADTHAQMETTKGYGWTDGAFGDGGRKISFFSMPDQDKSFYRISNGTREFFVTYFLEETEPGTGTRTYKGVQFTKDITTFHNWMGFLSWGGDYLLGIPDGFKQFDCTYGDDKNNATYAEDNFKNSLSAYTGSTGSESPYNNYYFLRKRFNVGYYNGDTLIGTKEARFERPIKSDYNLTKAQAEALTGTAMVSPYGEGYTFAGWYRDPACTIKEYFDGSATMPNAGNEYAIGVALYAKWEPIEHQVTTYLTKGGTKLNEYKIYHGETLPSRPADPVRTGYSFVAWFYEEDGVEKAYDFSLPVYKDMVLYAKWSSDTLVSGYIYYRDAQGNDLADFNEVKGAVGDTKTYNAKVGAELNLAPSGITYFPDFTSHSITFGDENPRQNDYTFIYTPKEKVGYTVYFIDKDTKQNVAAPVTRESGSATVTFDLLEEGIKVSKYTVDAMRKTFLLSSDKSLNNFYFYFIKDEENATVQVEHYIQTIDGKGYTLYFTDPISKAKIGSTVTAEYKTITGFSAYPSEPQTINGKALPDTGIVLKLYYSRNSYPYEFRFVYKEGTTETEFTEYKVSGTAKYGDTINEVGRSIPGYELISAGSMSITVAAENPATSANLRIFYYEEDQVTIRYQVGAGSGGGFVSVEGATTPQETLGAVNGTPKGATATADASGNYEFAGWYTDFACSNRVSEESTYVPGKTTDGVYVDATYYAKFKEREVTIYYAVDGAAGSATLSQTSEKVAIVSGLAGGSTVVSVADGYRFVGWYDANGNELSTVITYIPPRPSNSGGKWADGTTFYAKVVEKTATINYKTVGYGSVDPNSEAVSMVSGTANGSTAAAMEYSTFVGWYDNADCTGDPLSTEVTFKPSRPAGGWSATTYYAKFASKEYTISFDTKDGDPATIDPRTYSYGDTLELPTATKTDGTNYYQLTWRVKESVGNWTKDEVVTGGVAEKYGNVTLVAEWTITAIWISDSFNFADLPNFTEMPTVDKIKEITGVLDAKVLPYGENHESAAPTVTAREGHAFAWVRRAGVSGYVVYQASYTPLSYTITWNAGDGKFVDNTTEKTTRVRYGETPTAPETPTKAATAQYTYTFKEWTPEVVPVTGEATYTATYTAATRAYTVTWKNWDGTVLETDEDVPYGATPTYNGATPTKAATADSTYKFTGWSPEVKTVNGHAVYTAVFSEIGKATINYMIVGPDGCGSLTSYSEKVAVEAAAAAGSTASVSGNIYEFVGWYDNAECSGEPLTTEATFKPARPDGGWTENATYTYYGMFRLRAADFTIIRSGAASEDQVFVYRVEGNGLSIDVTIVGNNSVTITKLPFGTYTVTQVNKWSWRYSDAAQEGIAHNSAQGTEVEFANPNILTRWLSSNSELLQSSAT